MVDDYSGDETSEKAAALNLKVIRHPHNVGYGGNQKTCYMEALRSGATIQHNFLSGDRVEDIRIERRAVQYLYNDGNLYHFMDAETFDQMVLVADVLEEQTPYLKEGLDLVIAVYEGQPLEVELPTTVEMDVVDAEMAVAGDTATGATKKVTVETGLAASLGRQPQERRPTRRIGIFTTSGEEASRWIAPSRSSTALCPAWPSA